MPSIKNGTMIMGAELEEPGFKDGDFEIQIEKRLKIPYTEARKSDEIPGGGGRPAPLPGGTSPKTVVFPTTENRKESIP